LAIHQAIATWLARTAGAKAASAIASEIAAADRASALARCPRCAAEHRLESAGLLARIGRPEEAERRLRTDRGSPIDAYVRRRVHWMRATAEIAAARGDHGTAAATFEALAAIVEEAGMLEELVWVSIDIGRERSFVDRAAAVEALRRAAGLAERIGAPTHARVATKALRALGVRTWRRAPRDKLSDATHPGTGLRFLSPREREIAALVAAGRSNREIGATLDISPKTVERHLTNVLAKLTIRNRTELATMVIGGSVRDFPDE
jgi:DNA-binding CsgD family transcriptional regulator